MKISNMMISLLVFKRWLHSRATLWGEGQGKHDPQPWHETLAGVVGWGKLRIIGISAANCDSRYFCKKKIRSRGVWNWLDNHHDAFVVAESAETCSWRLNTETGKIAANCNRQISRLRAIENTYTPKKHPMTNPKLLGADSKIDMIVTVVVCRIPLKTLNTPNLSWEATSTLPARRLESQQRRPGPGIINRDSMTS